MRNGNEGIIYENDKWALTVLILPMRNGNIYINSFSLYALYSVLILPMRNGNIDKSQAIDTEVRVRSYPTYEEWKLVKFDVILSASIVPFLSYL